MLVEVARQHPKLLEGWERRAPPKVVDGESLLSSIGRGGSDRRDIEAVDVKGGVHDVHSYTHGFGSRVLGLTWKWG